MKRTLALLLLLLCLPVLALASSFEITSFTMDVRIAEDGSGLFTEDLFYDFEGSHNGFLVTLRHQGDLSISDLSLSVDDGIPLEQVDALDGIPYTYTAQEAGEAINLTIYAPGGEGARMLHLSYRVGGLARRYQDTARINHVFLRSETALENAMVRITLPGSDSDAVQFFIHGAASGTSYALDGGTLTIGPALVRSGNPLEVDLLFPAEWLPDARIIQQDMLAQALEEEAQAAEALRLEAVRKEEEAKTITTVVLALLAAYTVACFLIFLRLRTRYGTKHPILPRLDDALLSEMTAAEAEGLKNGSVSAHSLSATLLELTEMGVLSMRVEGEDTCFTPADPLKPLTAHQQMLLDWLFEGGEPLWVNSLDAGEDVESAARFTKGYNAWKQQVAKDIQDRGWRFANDGVRYACMIGAPVIGLALASFLLRYGAWPLAIPGAVLAVGFAILFGRIRKITDAGEAQLSAIQGFVDSYADRLQSDPKAVLGRAPLAMALGYMQPMADWIDAHPDMDGYGWESMPPYWSYAGWHLAMVHMDDTVNEAQSHNAGTSSQGSDSGSSGGSGFTGGSGGGNSYGAW